MGWDEEAQELITYFVGPCSCKHEQDEHGWGSCGVDGCKCEAGWEE